MKLKQLTKPQIILLWMTTASRYQDAFSEEDKEVLIKNKAFKDRKSISNALYQLHQDGYITKFKNSWCILDAGKQHLADAIAVLQEEADKPEPKAPKAEEWTDADFGITPEVRTYIDKLEAENAKLKELLEHYKQMHSSNLATYDALAAKNEQLKCDIELLRKIWKNLRDKIEEYEAENNKLKNQLKELNSKYDESYVINIDACNKFADACSEFIKSINPI